MDEYLHLAKKSPLFYHRGSAPLLRRVGTGQTQPIPPQNRETDYTKGANHEMGN